MISKKDIIKMARKVTRRSQGYQERKLMNPRRDWLIGVAVFLLVALTGGVLNARTYVYFNTIESRVQETPVPVKKYREHEAQAAIERYQNREAQFAALVGQVRSVPAPAQGTSTATSSDESEGTDGDSQTAADTGTDTTGTTSATEAEPESATSTQLQ